MKKTTTRLIRNETEGVIQKLTCNLLPSQCRLDTLEEREYTVVPMVILVEGVHNGTDGPLYYPKEELEKIPAVWNHKPVVVYHPEMNGVGISACDPNVINNRKVGLMMNTRFEGGKLKSEAWIDKDRADKVDQRIMAAVTANEMMELSTGVYVDVDPTPGEWKGESYKGVARNYRADHLALLPDKTGACSIKDGAGFLRNQEAGRIAPFMAVLQRALQRMGLAGNEMSFSNIRETLSTMLRKKFNADMNDGPFLFVEDVYSNFVIYEKEGKLFRLGYTAGDAGVTLSDETPVEVVRVTEYRTVEGAFVGNQDHQTTTPKPAMKEKEKKKLVDEIVGNSGWSETDREKLMSFTGDQITSIHKGIQPPVENDDQEGEGDDKGGEGQGDDAPAKPASAQTQTAPKAGEQAGKAPADNAQAPVAPRVPTLKEYVDNAPPEVREVLNNSLAVHQEEKKKLIDSIVANKHNAFEKKELENRPLGELRKLARLAAGDPAVMRSPNYSGQAPVPTDNTEDEEEAMAVPTMNFDKAAK